MKKIFTRERLTLIIWGILMGLSFPPFPFPFQLLMFVGLVPLFLILEKKERLIDINRSAYLYFFFFNLFTIYWVGSWQEKSDPFLMISGILLVFVNPVFFLIPTTLLYYSRAIFNKKYILYLIPFFWVTYEYAYMITDASFPWLTLGNGLAPFYLFMQPADIIGAVGLSLVVVLINVLITRGIQFKEQKKYMYRYTGVAAAIMVIFIVYGVVRTSSFQLSDKTIKVGIIQPNLDPWDKWGGGELNELLKIYLDLSDEAIKQKAELLVWPETALPVYLFTSEYSKTVDSINSYLSGNNVSLLTGVPLIKYYDKRDSMPSDVKYSKEADFYYATYNGVVLMNPAGGVMQEYGKSKLVPFGERVPFVDQLPFLGNWIKWGVGLSGWNVGKDTTVFNYKSREIDSVKINALVCYESVYPYYVNAFVNKGADILAVVTNDSWYGRSSGPYQHKEIGILRAVENRKSVLRSANGGISCVIDPLGRTTMETELFVKTQLTGDVIVQKGETFFSRFPYIIPISSSAFSLWIIGIFFLKKLKNVLKA